MKYIIAHMNDGVVEIEGVTTDLMQAVSEYEPIDVVDGHMVAWDDEANLYHFTSQNPVGDTSASGIGVIVDTGNWSGDDPQLKLISQNDADGLRVAILDYLKQDKLAKKRWWSKKEISHQDKKEYESLNLNELMALVESTD